MIDFRIDALTIVRILAFSSLFGLLLAIGLETRFRAILNALRHARIEATLLANFLLVPLYAATLTTFFALHETPARAMMLLAAAPFAPVVPLFVRMAGGNLALATGLTGLFPILAALMTPAALGFGLWLLGDIADDRPSSLLILEVLMSSITLPLALGLGLGEAWPRIAKKIHKPIEWISEAVGVLSLVFLSTLEASHLRLPETWTLLPSVCFYEGCFLIGLYLMKTAAENRLVFAFGTGNRNIGLAILLAAIFDQGIDLLGDVLGQSLLMLGLGLIHVGIARLYVLFRHKITKS
jgi:bile acid:Na+ symporter, BASS family